MSYSKNTTNTDAIWDAAGDIIQGTAANTAARLAIGTPLQQLRVNAGATALEYFTPSASSGDIINGGNTTGAAITIGTNDAFGLNFETNNVTRLAITGGASTGGAVTITNVTANTATVQDVLTLQTNSTGAPAAGFGPGILFQGESATVDNRDMARFAAYWTTATDASKEAAFSWQLEDSGTPGVLAEVMKLDRIASTGQLTLGSANPVIISRSNITTGLAYTIGNSGNALTLSSTSTTLGITITSSGVSTTGTAGLTIGTTAYTSSTLSKSAMRFNDTYTPTTGSGTFNFLEFAGTINQSTGGTGITRGLYLNTTLTSPADYRSIESANGKIKFTDTQSAGSGSLAGSLLDLAQTWNTSGAPAAIKLNVTNTASDAASLLMDLQVGGVSALKVDVAGRTTFTNVVRLKGYTVATLPTGTIGDTAFVTDALSPTYLGLAVGGGAVVARVFFNGTIWTTQ